MYKSKQRNKFGEGDPLGIRVKLSASREQEIDALTRRDQLQDRLSQMARDRIQIVPINENSPSDCSDDGSEACQSSKEEERSSATTSSPPLTPRIPKREPSSSRYGERRSGKHQRQTSEPTRRLSVLRNQSRW